MFRVKHKNYVFVRYLDPHKGYRTTFTIVVTERRYDKLIRAPF